jgi:hypothetical protein
LDEARGITGHPVNCSAGSIPDGARGSGTSVQL